MNIDSVLSSQIQQSQTAFDFSQFEKMKAQARGNEKATLEAVAEQFESIFIKMAIDSMRKANQYFKSDLSSSSYQDFYQGMYDEQLSLELANQGGIGLKEALVRYLSQQNQNNQTKNQLINDKHLLNKGALGLK